MKLGRRIACDLNAEQTAHFWQAAGVRRFAWNWALARWNEAYAAAKLENDPDRRKALWPSTAKLKGEWAAVRRTEFPWSLDVTKCAGTQAIMDLGATFSRAFQEQREAKTQRRKPRKMFGFPRFKAKQKATPGFALWNDQFSICNIFSHAQNAAATVRIPNLGHVRLREAVPSLGGILGARCSYRRGRWFIAFQFDMDWNDGEQSDKASHLAQSKARKAAIEAGMTREEAAAAITVRSGKPTRLLPIHPRVGTVGGGDLGLVDSLVCRVESKDKPTIEFRAPNPRRLLRTEKQARLRRKRERKLSRSIHKARLRVAEDRKRQKGDTTPVTGAEFAAVKHRLSNRQWRLSRQLSNEHWTMADRRGDFLHKLSHRVSRQAEIMVLEDLYVTGMMANRRLSRSLSDAALGTLASFIEYKAEREGGLVLWAPRFFPSSKRCFACGHVHAELGLGDREWGCTACGVVHDRDANAAMNLCWLGHIASGLDPIPAECQAWAVWIHEARGQVAEWRARKNASRVFQTSAPALDLGMANPPPQHSCVAGERGECTDRARRNPGRGVHDEPRTTQADNLVGRGGQTHVCSPSG